MKELILEPRNYRAKTGQSVGVKKPTITESCLFIECGKVVGFYLKDLPEKQKKLLLIANKEFRSKNVPKSMMSRSSAIANRENGGGVEQYSTIIGSVPPKPHMRRPEKSTSSVHGVESAKTYVGVMQFLANEAAKTIKEFMPSQYDRQKELFSRVDEKWKFGEIFTSSIANYNISADYHIDNGNIKDTVNAIYTTRKDAQGGSLNIPRYGATVEQEHLSLLVYPAWRDLHGVTDILELRNGGYRNSFIFYPLKAFLNK